MESLPLLSCHAPPCYAGADKSHPLFIKYTRNPVEANEFIRETSGTTTDKIYGLDIEWKVTYGAAQRPTALLQLCDGISAYLFHLCHMESFPSALRELLEDPTIQMSGVAIRGDAQRLQKDYGILCAGLVDLGSISGNYLPALAQTAFTLSSRSSMERIMAGKPSLQALVEVFLQHYLPKGPVRISNWEALPLSIAQIDYAANDALASYAVYQQFRYLSNLLPLDPGPIATIDIRAEVAQQDRLVANHNRFASLRKRGWSGSDDDDFFEEVAEAEVATRSTAHDQETTHVAAAMEDTEQSILQDLENMDPTLFATIFDNFDSDDDFPFLDTSFDLSP